MTDDPILKTIEKIVYLHDGVADSNQPGTLNVLLSESVAKSLEVEEELTFTTTAEVREGYFVTYNSDILKKFEALLGQKGCVATLGVKYDGYLKTTGFEKQVADALTPLNGLLRVKEAKIETTQYLLCNIAYQANADENRLGMVSFFVNELTGVAPVDIGDALLWEADRIEIAEGMAQSAVAFEKLSQAIAKTAERFVDKDIEKWRNSLNRKQQRDEERLKTYYSAIVQEIRAKIKKKHLEGEEEEKELSRIAATERELERKLADIRDRYALTVEAQLHSALAIQMPTVHIECELVRKKHRRIVTAVWNPFSKKIEPLRCEKSDVPIYSFYLSDDGAQIISPECWKG